MSALIKKMIEKTRYYRDVVPVFRIQQRSLDEQEALAAQLGQSVAGQPQDSKARVTRGTGRSDILLSEGIRSRVYHASGAIAVSAGLAPMEHLIGEKADKDALTNSVAETAKRFGLNRFASASEQLIFERLWQIKAGGMNSEGVRGRDVVCRAVGAFRRYLHDLPVWGRASAVVEVAGDGKIGGIGIDWRPAAREPVDRAKIIDPERAAQAVLGDLNGRIPGGEMGDDDFDVAMFSLGYVSLPKRRPQSVFAPVYVAMLERRGWTTMNYVIVVDASETMYESYCRPTSSSPGDATKPQPGSDKAKQPRAPGWDPLVKPPVY